MDPVTIQPALSTFEDTKNLIEVHGLQKAFYVGNTAVEVLKGINLVIPEGSFTIIYGASGSGKSTLLNALTGLDAPTSGKVLFAGQDLYALPIKELAHFRAHTMGMVQQTNYWVKSLSVLENVAIPLYFLGMPKSKAEEQALDSLQRVQMGQHAKKYPTILSGGEQQRVAMARALINNPQYIVADEPTGSLDSKNGDAIIQWLQYFNKALGRTIVLVTHNIEYLPVGDQILLIDDGIISGVSGKSVHASTDRLLDDMKRRINRWKNVNE